MHVFGYFNGIHVSKANVGRQIGDFVAKFMECDLGMG